MNTYPNNRWHDNLRVIAKGGGSIQARENHDDCPWCEEDEECEDERETDNIQ
jgi:hypothetical protein